MNIREATKADFAGIWPIFQEIVTAANSYTYPPDTTEEEAFDIWLTRPHKTFVMEEDGVIIGTYYIKQNQPGPGSHVCNCGYMVASQARGHGIATAMCLHSQETAVTLGYKAMQFNLVVSTNVTAVKLWQKLGFNIVGQIPQAFSHPTLGFVDAFVMYKWL
ncbi:MAG: GNAT family N-acetyltransferase [Chloroflexi bacterium]|nr:GNAT family N-acetyltransferase [Chloroflexota bacterium]